MYDLLDLPPGRSAKAERLIAAHEAAHGPVPASLREWYTVPNIVPLGDQPGVPFWRRGEGSIWYEYSNEDNPAALAGVLDGLARPGGRNNRSVPVVAEREGVCSWWVEADGADDPPVWTDIEHPDDPARWALEAATFSLFVWEWFSRYHAEEFTPLSRKAYPLPGETSRDVPKPHEGEHWACSPAAAYPVPVLDFLGERLDDPARTPVSPAVATLTYRSADGEVRVTTDDPAGPAPHAAWWVAGPTAEGFARLRGLLAPWGVLGPGARGPAAPAGE